MSQELIYTSAPRGLLPGTSGFCTVARTSDMSPTLAGYLESLSGYRHLFPPQSENAALNPVAFSHGIVRIGQSSYHILSRVASAGLDHTKRSNNIAHHIILRENELSSCGPAWILSQPNLFLTQWNSPPKEITESRILPSGNVKPQKCVLWERFAGDAGWGGVLAETAMNSRPVCILFKPGTDLLPLIAESIALLPEKLRWKSTFCTYLTELPSGVACQWKCVLGGTAESLTIRAARGTLVI
ncbi:MAG: hypothetical protein ACRC2T_06695, partial [Thermoguttaceae bacterium]